MSHGHAVHLSRLTDGTLLTITRTEEGALLENEDSRLLVKEDFQIVGRDEYLHLCLRSGPRGIRKIGGRIKLIPAFVPATLFGDDHIPVSDLGMRRSSGSLCFWYKDSWIWRSNSRRSQGQIGETNILAAAPSPGFLALVYVKDHVPFLKLVDHDNTTGTDIPLSLSTINDLCWYRETVLAIAGIHEVNSNIVFIDVISKRATEIAYDGTISALAVSESRLYGMTASAISSPALAQLYPQVNVVSTQTIRTHYYTDNPSIVIPGSNQNLVIFLHGGPIGCWHNTYNPITEALSSQGFHVILFNSSGSNVGSKSRLLAADYGRVDLQELFQAFREMAEDYPTSAIHIVGDSYGGYLAWLFAVQMQKLPRRICSLVILNGFMSPDDLESDNPAVRVLKKCLPKPPFRRPDVDNILFVTSRNDRLICSAGIELNCETLGISCKVMNSGHQISDTKLTMELAQTVIDTLHNN